MRAVEFYRMLAQRQRFIQYGGYLLTIDIENFQCGLAADLAIPADVGEAREGVGIIL